MDTLITGLDPSTTTKTFKKTTFQNNHPTTIVSTRNEGTTKSAEKLLNISFESNPPSEPDSDDLDHDPGSLYDKRIGIFSSPLEIIYDKPTVNALINLFKTPDEMNLANLQSQAFAKLKEYKESSSLSLQYVIDNHSLIDVDIKLDSSFVIVPLGGQFHDSEAVTVVNLGSITVNSKPISEETRHLKVSLFIDINY
jgi:hypothetical protein